MALSIILCAIVASYSLSLVLLVYPHLPLIFRRDVYLEVYAPKNVGVHMAPVV